MRLFTLLLVVLLPRHGCSFSATTGNAYSFRSHGVDDPLASRATAFGRAKDIGVVMTRDLIIPAIESIATNGASTSWNDFWGQKSKSRQVTNADMAANALESLGPTYVKFGQALSARLDLIPKSLADALARLQDEMEPFDDVVAHGIIRKELEQTGVLSSDNLETLMKSLSAEAVAAASIGQVYKGFIPGRGAVALKVQRPGIRLVVEQDATLLRNVAQWIESIPTLPGESSKATMNKQKKLVSTKVVGAVDEFMSRVFEELDYQNEAKNMETFYRLYSHVDGSSRDVKVVVPAVHLDLCTEKLIVMQWIDGTKISNTASDGLSESENLTLIQAGITATLSQLLGFGIMHADPHAGNLLKVSTDQGLMLGFLDFGLLSTVPESVRDALVCAVAQVVFARDTEAVADLFGELQLLPAHVISDPVERNALKNALEKVFLDVLHYPPQNAQSDGVTPVPFLRFDKLLAGLSLLVSRFPFSLPPYFLNIARALATLEGFARELDPSFNALRAVYPYALERILNNPSMSPVVERTLISLIVDQKTGRFDKNKAAKLVQDAAVLGGTKKRKVMFDVLRSRTGRKIIGKIFRDGIKSLPRKTLRPRKLLYEL